MRLKVEGDSFLELTLAWAEPARGGAGAAGGHHFAERGHPLRLDLI